MKTITTDIHPLLARVMGVVEQVPEREAVVDKDGNAISYGELRDLIVSVQQELRSKGIQKGSRILVAVPMSINLYALLLALFSLGGIAIFLDPWMKGKKMEEVINTVNPQLLVISPNLRWLAYAMPATRKISSWWVLKSLRPSHQALNFTSVEDSDTALITFTSGTSGRPKGADRTFGFLSAQMNALKGHLKRKAPQRDYTNFPIVGLADLGVGNTVIVPKINLMKIHQAKPLTVKNRLFKHQATRMIVSPSLLGRAMETQDSLRGLNEVFVGGAPIPFLLIEKGLSLYPSLKFEAIFGSTEAEPVAVTTFQDMKGKMDDPLKGVFVGTPEQITNYQFVKAINQPIDEKYLSENRCTNGEPGELLVSGNHVNKTYFENEEAFLKNKVIDHEGTIWHRMGDVGYQENEGIFLVGRLHRVMTFEGKKLYPFPFESYIQRKLGWLDVGYIQNRDGQFLLFVGGGITGMHKAWEAASKAGYPLDQIIKVRKPLPRDARHRSKLDVEALHKLRGEPIFNPTTS